MANLQVKNVPVEIYEELRRRSSAQHQTIRDYVLALLRKDQELPSLEDWLSELPASPLTTGSFDARDVVEAARAERSDEIEQAEGA